MGRPDAVKELEQIAFDVYPNPTTDYLRIDDTQNQIDKFSIINMEGKVVLYGEWKGEISVINLEKGIYIISLYEMNSRKVKSKRFSKQ